MFPFIAIFCSSILWSISTQIFALQGRSLSVFRLNFYKACLSFLFFTFTAFVLVGDTQAFHILWYEKPKVFLYLCLSGVSGFAIADLFVFRAFAIMGAARILMILCFAPIFVAIYAYFILGTVLTSRKICGLFFLVACVFSLSFDKKQKLPFSWQAVILCLTGLTFDSLGVVLSKLSFVSLPELNSAQANVIRVGVSIPVIFMINKIFQKSLSLHDLPKRQIILIFTGSFVGTFLALLCYLYAISHIEAAVVAGLASITPVYASIYEHIRDKITPSKAFYCALIFMFCGVYLLV